MITWKKETEAEPPEKGLEAAAELHWARKRNKYGAFSQFGDILYLIFI